MAGGSSRITYRTPFSTDHKAIQWLFRVLTCQILIRNCFTAVLLKHWNRFSERARAIQNIRKHEAGGPRKRMLIISISRYTNGWRVLYGPKTDWKFWAMLGTMSGWNVEVLADSLPTEDPARQPKRDNIRRFARDHLRGNGKGDQFIVVYAGHCDNQGLVLADGSRISPQELRDWFVKPLALGSFLWAFFDCCESSNLLGQVFGIRSGAVRARLFNTSRTTRRKARTQTLRARWSLSVVRQVPLGKWTSMTLAYQTRTLSHCTVGHLPGQRTYSSIRSANRENLSWQTFYRSSSKSLHLVKGRSLRSPHQQSFRIRSYHCSDLPRQPQLPRDFVGTFLASQVRRCCFALFHCITSESPELRLTEAWDPPSNRTFRMIPPSCLCSSFHPI